MMYPLVRELAADGVPVTVTCRVLNLARQPYYRWLADPVTDTEWREAQLANALFDAHRDDPEFGYRFLADQARADGHVFADRTAWKICSANGWFSVFGKKKSRKKSRPGAPACDDLVGRQFTAAAPNLLWLADITEHRTDEGKLYCCAIKDVFSNRIVGYAIDSRMKARLAVTARSRSPSPAAVTSPAALSTATGAVNFDLESSIGRCCGTAWSDRWARPAPPPATPPWNRSSRSCSATSWTVAGGQLASSCGSRSSPGTNAATTAGAGRPRSAG